MWHVTVHVTWRFHDNHILTGMFVQNFNFSYLKIKQKLSCSIFLKSLDQFMVFLFVLITVDPILDNFFEVLDKSSNPPWPPFRNDYSIIKSYDVITSWCGRQRRHFQTFYLPYKSTCHSLYILGVTEGGGGGGNDVTISTHFSMAAVLDFWICPDLKRSSKIRWKVNETNKNAIKWSKDLKMPQESFCLISK